MSASEAASNHADHGARAEVFARIRQSLRAAESTPEPPLASAPPPPAGATAPDSRSLWQRYVDHATAVDAVIHESSPANLDRAAEIIATLLRERSATRLAVSDAPAVAYVAMRLRAAVDGLEILPPGTPRAELLTSDAGMFTVRGAVAETGTLWLDHDAERNRLVSLLPPLSIALLDPESVQTELDDVLALGTPPRAMTFVTGPSRTADIELTLVVGVHGPTELHVVPAPLRALDRDRPGANR